MRRISKRLFLEKIPVFSDAFTMKILFVVLALGIPFSILSKKSSSINQIFRQTPKMVDLDEIEKVKKESSSEEVTPKLVSIQKEESQTVNLDERIPASLDKVEEKQTVKRKERLSSLVRESLLDKEMAERDLDSVIEEDDLFFDFDNEDTKEDFGDVEVRWKTSN